jgi:hypothetical protein
MDSNVKIVAHGIASGETDAHGRLNIMFLHELMTKPYSLVITPDRTLNEKSVVVIDGDSITTSGFTASWLSEKHKPVACAYVAYGC